MLHFGVGLSGTQKGVLATVTQQHSKERTSHQIDRKATPSLPAPSAFRTIGERSRDLEQIEINAEFQHALALIERDCPCLFLTGKAGTGKSTLLHYVRETSTRATAVLAPTGVAALNVGGQTIHSFFRFPPTLIDPGSLRKRRGAKLFRKLETLIIDEVSMVRADVMDGIDTALRLHRDAPHTPFGGVQVILCGDLFQLPPIVRERDMQTFFDQQYGGPYFFRAKVFADLQPSSVELTTIYRQHDEAFISALNKIRENDVDAELLAMLNARVQRGGGPPRDSSCITLTATNQAAFRKNQACLERLAERSYTYPAECSGQFEDAIFPTEALLELKPGAQVMLIRNDPYRRWVNGTIGRVSRLSDTTVRVEIGGTEYEVEPETWQNIRYRYNQETNRIEEEEIGSFTQYPLRLAWAITIHKSQGQTFDKVLIDLGRGAFAHGQTYVALSRCTSLEGLVFSRPVTARDMVFDERVYDCRRVFPPAPGPG